MELAVFITTVAVIGATALSYSLGYRRGLNAKKLVIESLSFKQAMKWWAYHEILRHNDDIRNIRDDIRKLATVEMPKGIDYAAWVNIEGNPKVKSKRQGGNPLA